MAISFDSASNSGPQTSSTYSWSHTCTGSDLFLVVDVGGFRTLGLHVSGVTYNGIAMTKIAGPISSQLDFECWGLIAPDSGAHDVAVTLSDACDSGGMAVSYTGVDQTTPTEGAVTNSDNSAAPVGFPTTSVSGAWCHAGVIATGPPSSMTATQTERTSVDGSAATDPFLASCEDTVADFMGGTTEMDYTLGESQNWFMSAFAILPSVAATGGAPYYYRHLAGGQS